MAENTKIEWADDTVSFWWGCTHDGPGCLHCYAEKLSKRSGQFWGPRAPRLWIKSAIDECYRLNRKAKREGKPRLVFINSMSDFFEEHTGSVVDREKDRVVCCDDCEWLGGLPVIMRQNGPQKKSDDCPECGKQTRSADLNDLRVRAFRCFYRCDMLRFLLLTKRPENIPRMWPTIDKQSADVGVLLANHFRAVDARIAAGGVSNDPAAEHVAFQGELNRVAYRPNCWLGTSISTQSDADRNVPLLRACRELAPVLFLSVEPLIEAVDLKLNLNWWRCSGCGFVGSDDNEVGFGRCGKCGHELDAQDECKIDWVIIGCESRGKKAGRFADGYEAAARSLNEQCKAAGVAVFNKQMPLGGIVSHDPNDWPSDLRSRDLPTLVCDG